MKDSKLKRFFENRIVIACLSLLIALVAWIAVVLTVSPNTTRTIYNVPVTLPVSGASYQTLGLDVLNADADELTVNLTVVGERNIVGALTKDSFNVVPVFTGVTKEGTYQLALSVTTKGSQVAGLEIKNISPTAIELTFAPVVTKTFKVEVITNGLTAPSGYILNTIVAEPAEVVVTATQAAMDKVARAAAYIEGDRLVSTTQTSPANIVLLDATGVELDMSMYRLDTRTVDVTVPVYKRATLKLEIGFSNVPDGFDLSSLEYVMSVNEINIAAPENIANSLTSRVVGYIDLAQFNFGQTYSFPITLGTGIVNLDNIASVQVTFPRADLQTKRLNVSDIRIIGVNAQYDYKLLTTRINSVTVIGPQAEIDAISAGSVVAIVDVSSVALVQGENRVTVYFEIPAFSRSWAVGAYSVSIEVNPK